MSAAPISWLVVVAAIGLLGLAAGMLALIMLVGRKQ